jgi:hypothetical protein
MKLYKILFETYSNDPRLAHSSEPLPGVMFIPTDGSARPITFDDRSFNDNPQVFKAEGGIIVVMDKNQKGEQNLNAEYHLDDATHDIFGPAVFVPTDQVQEFEEYFNTKLPKPTPSMTED